MSDDGAVPEEELDDYESGPFCAHWGELGYCTDECGTCHHPCHGGNCKVNDCGCKEGTE